MQKKSSPYFGRIRKAMDGKAVELLALFIAYLTACVKGEIRCYCNVAPCVSTGYMCKSDSFCFSHGLVHGCVGGRGHCKPGMRCCEEDMCNYAHATPITGSLEEGSMHDVSSKTSSVMETHQVWFRAAVIAVPIGGACVLAVIVAAAARMLRRDAIQKRIVHGYSPINWNKHATLV